jgi:hypothetical protein
VAQKIAHFEEVTTSTQAVTRSKPQDRTFSNMLQSAESPHRVTIFLIDLVNTRVGVEKLSSKMRLSLKGVPFGSYLLLR